MSGTGGTTLETVRTVKKKKNVVMVKEDILDKRIVLVRCQQPLNQTFNDLMRHLFRHTTGNPGPFRGHTVVLGRGMFAVSCLEGSGP
jgi:hypothetical protein